MELRTIEWKNDSVVMIDQTKLPNELVFVKYSMPKIHTSFYKIYRRFSFVKKINM